MNFILGLFIGLIVAYCVYEYMSERCYKLWIKGINDNYNKNLKICRLEAILENKLF